MSETYPIETADGNVAIAVNHAQSLYFDKNNQLPTGATVTVEPPEKNENGNETITVLVTLSP